MNLVIARNEGIKYSTEIIDYSRDCNLDNCMVI